MPTTPPGRPAPARRGWARKRPHRALPLAATDLKGRLAYRYSRFSSVKQEKGWSLARQEKLARECAAWLGARLDDASAVVDERTSAWTGRNRAPGGGLDLIIRLGEDRKIAEGSILLVEAIDRLSREPMLDALDTLKKIVRAGWVIVTAEDGAIYDEAAMNGPMGLVLVAKIQQANAVANSISDRVGETWAGKRHLAAQRAVPLTKHCPGWLRLKVKEGFEREPGHENCFYHPEPVHVETIRLIFRLAAQGLGRDKIAAILNEQGHPPIGRSIEDVRPPDKGWRGNRVGQILRDERVLGWVWLGTADGDLRIPERKVKLYPAIIEPEEWIGARKAVEAKQRHVGRRGESVSNLFTRLAFCGCGARLAVRSGAKPLELKQGRPTERDRYHWHYLACSDSFNGRGCPHKTRFRLRVWESVLLRAVAISPPKLPDEAASEARAARERLAGLDLDIEQAEDNLEALRKVIGKSRSGAMSYSNAMQELDALRDARDTAAVEAAAREDAAGRGGIVAEAREAMAALADAAVSPRRDAEARERVRTLLPQVVERIEANGLGGLTLVFRDGQRAAFDAEGHPTTAQYRVEKIEATVLPVADGDEADDGEEEYPSLEDAAAGSTEPPPPGFMLAEWGGPGGDVATLRGPWGWGEGGRAEDAVEE